MNDFETIVSLLDFTLNTKRKRHIVGGVLLSVSALFGGLALTIMTLDQDEKEKKDEQKGYISSGIRYWDGRESVDGEAEEIEER